MQTYSIQCGSLWKLCWRIFLSLGKRESGYRAINLKILISSVCAALVLSTQALQASIDDEVAIRQQLIQFALAKEDADLILRGATTLNVFSSTWMPDQEIVIREKNCLGRS